MDGREVTSKARLRLSTPELSKWIEKIKVKILSEDPLFDQDDSVVGTGRVLYLRLTSAEREMLRAAASGADGHSPPRDTGWHTEDIRKVATLLFLRWYVGPFTIYGTLLHIFGLCWNSV